MVRQAFIQIFNKLTWSDKHSYLVRQAFKHSTWSQTPVVSPMLAITYAGLLPSVQLTPSAFSHTSGIIPVTTTIHFSGLNTQPASLIHPASDSPLRAGPRTSLLIWWLTFNQVGLESLLILTHWVTLSNFIPPSGNPNDLSLSRHDKCFVRVYVLRYYFSLALIMVLLINMLDLNLQSFQKVYL